MEASKPHHSFGFLLTHNRVAVAIRRPFRRGRRRWRQTRQRRRHRHAIVAWQRPLYLVREFAYKRSRPGTYRLRGTPFKVRIRHQSDDTLVMGEVFLNKDYRPPDRVVAALSDTPRRVVSLGGHIGLFGLDCFVRWPEAQITEVEAEHENAELFRGNVDRNGLADRWGLIEAFADTSAGPREVLRGQGTSLVRLAAGADVPAERVEVPAIDVFPLLERADLIKMDIEGGEWKILFDPRFKDLEARAIVLEHHYQLCPEESPRAAATKALTGAGFEVVPLRMKPNGVGLIWGIRADP